MPLGDALYTITMSAGRSVVKTRTDFTVTDWNSDTNRLALVDNMLYFTGVELITNSALVDGASGPAFLEAYLNNTDEGSFLWSMPLGVKYAASNATGRNYFQFFQPVRANQVYFGIRTVHPYPDSHGGSMLDMNADSSIWLLNVMQTPRSFT